ncbi:hypothetical protein M5D96_008369 [Drosophila gunungcola]|uniref:Uncharacterized protein n=1 Tax=Drosophila gunungcola TaxID=103775 RepID=A0A9P9YK90_9MUSC|nr:hypothetical protein M5D96_008369 [Drosophila gunungcola]
MNLDYITAEHTCSATMINDCGNYRGSNFCPIVIGQQIPKKIRRMSKHLQRFLVSNRIKMAADGTKRFSSADRLSGGSLKCAAILRK